ncbi:MAG: ribonuclease [Xanthobacteraceae bacterium]|nr:ribonuclease [Xanthobacteraceae bacterium]
MSRRRKGAAASSQETESAGSTPAVPEDGQPAPVKDAPAVAADTAASSPAGTEAAPLPNESPPKKPKRRRRGAGALEDRIGYHFKDGALLDLALTHISALTGTRNRTGSYQRLEFLGDHVLGLVISDLLFRGFPKADEGELSRRLADLVRTETCAEIARSIDLGASIRLGTSEANAGGRLRTAILADVCEALIGAVFLDRGYAEAASLIERLWSERMRTSVRALRDAKTMLQEWAQARGLPAPTYREVERIGPHHDPQFRVAVELRDRPPAEGHGRSKRSAEQSAAAVMLTREGVNAELPDV